ncbi:MAG: cryptochrome/photolyase family protein [Anaerolineae bacterium]|jgi:deoxyribodipyrimidine photolyase-related protein
MGDERASVWILGDQLLALHPALAAAEQEHARENLRLVLVESWRRTRRLPYQRKKLVLLFSAMRHYAEELRTQGYAVDYVQAPTFLDGLRQHVAAWKPSRLFAMEASAWRVRTFQRARLAEELGLPVTLVPNTQFLVGRFDPYPGAEASKRVLMEYFYRRMRRHFDVLMAPDGKPVGGKWNYDAENRKPLPPDAEPPPVPTFEPDAITREVMAEVEAAAHGVGTANGFDLAVTRQQALSAFDDFLANRLAQFGPYEDAMSSQHPVLYHSLLSPYLNIGLLEPLELISAVEGAYHRERAPINSTEGFVRQVLGWREYIYWQYWRLMPDLMEANAWDAQRPLPSFFWDAHTEMNCLHHAIGRAIDSGYNHHIERLMLLCNFCLLAGIQPGAVNDWFLSFYVDAYEWVMAPNVIGMGLNADSGLVATKPYIASANYINRMGDYCLRCRYDHKQRTGRDACPFNFLYWNFLLEHEDTLRANPRLGRNVYGLRYLDEDERGAVRRQTSSFLDKLES